MAGDGAPGGLPLISRFSRPAGGQPAGNPVSLPVTAGTLILVNQGEPLAHALSSQNMVRLP